MARRRGMAWKPRQLKPVIVRRIPAVGRANSFIPWEDHPDWSLFGAAGPSPTIFNPITGSVENTAVIPSNTWFSIMNTEIGLVEDCEMSCVIDYEGLASNYETYMLAKGLDEDNFTGVTSYNSKIMLYERVGGAWNNLGVEIPAAGTKGKEIRITFINDEITLYVDGARIGSAASSTTGQAHMGSLLRGHPIAGKMWHDMRLSKIVNSEIVTYQGNYVTYNGEVVTHG